MDPQDWIKACILIIISGSIIIALGGVLVDGTHYKIDKCETSAGNLGVQPNINHSAVCSHPCHRTLGKVWGTVEYTYDSAFCRAATHDNRISTWNTSQRTVNFILYNKDNDGKYYGSYQQGVRTLDYRELFRSSDGHYVFTSPRIEEPLLDVTSVSRGFLTSNNEDVVQECHLGAGAKNLTITFDYYLQRYSGHLSYPDPLNPAPKGGSVSGANQWVTATWKQDPSGFFFPGGLWCIPGSTTYSRVLSLTMDEKADFRPFLWTTTASVGDTVSIYMQAKTDTTRLVWKKDSTTFYAFSPQTSEEVNRDNIHSLIFRKVVLGNRGLYSLEKNERTNNLRKKGVTRLIIRSCPNGIYGPSCEHNCPPCENGGVCHDVMGGCICPPGFNGTLCESPCGDNYFGATCNRMCSESNPGGEPTCRGLLFCLPDPFGCTCGTGFHGLDCKIKCRPGQFGAGCRVSRDCHCEGEDSFCNIFTGLCPNGCKQGWKDIACVTSYPYLHTAPKLLRGGGSTDLELQLYPWNRQYGKGTPVAYIVEIKKNESESANEEYVEVARLNYNDQMRMVNVSLDRLQPNTRYSVRAVLLDEDGQAQKDLAPPVTFRTACGEPGSPPEDFVVLFSNPKAVGLSWKYPDRSTWNCDSVKVRVEYNTSQTSTSMLFSNRTQYSFLTEPFTQWRLAVRLETPNNKTSNWSKVIEGTSAEDAPSKVQGANLTFNAENQSLLVSWEEPLKLNGRIRHYLVQLHHLKWLHSNCPTLELKNDVEVKEREFTFINVNFSSLYRVHIYGVTVIPGVVFYKDFTTPESVPSSPPIDMVASQIQARMVMIGWSPSDCQFWNGNIRRYVVWREGLSEWDRKVTNRTVAEQSLVFHDLTPFSVYQFRVQVCTQVGCGETYASINVTTLSDKPTAPRNLTIYQSTMTSLEFFWLEPRPPHGLISIYTMSQVIQEKGKRVSPTYTTSHASDIRCSLPGLSNAYCFKFSGLDSMKNYLIEVSAINENGTGLNASSTGMTDESIPDEPEMVNVTERRTNSATVVWSLPLRQNGKILGFQVNVTMEIGNGGSRAILSRTTTGRERKLMIWDLKPATYYHVFVSANTSKGYGPSTVQKFSTRSPTLTIKETPALGAILDNTVVLVIKPVNLMSIPMSAYFVLVREVVEDDENSEKERRRKRRCSYDPKQGKRRRRCSGSPSDSNGGKGYVSLDPFPTNYNKSREQNKHIYVAGKLEPLQVPQDGYNFQIGDGSIYNGYYNAPLVTGHMYKLGMAVVSEYPGDPKVCALFLEPTVTVRKPKEDSAPSVALVVGMVVICLLAITAFLLFLYYKKPGLFHSVKDKANRSFFMKNNKEGGPRSTLNESSYSLELRTDSTPMKGIHSNRVAVADLERFVREGIESGKIEEEFQSVNKGQLHAIDVGRLQENKCKNRYGNLLPYDHSRVVLDKINNDEFSDYINASIIDGYKTSQKYIATQGPKPVTLNDFWRMVWQKNVCKIAMVTNVLENGKVKCEKYWPDTTDRYGQFTIEQKEVSTYSDYVIRTFQISKSEKDNREVVQFHFTTWADHQVPMYPMAMGGFLKRLRAYQPESKAPIVVHCSAGVGRTGTLILVDSMMDMAAEENTVDLLAQFWSMRQQRINLVENQGQYVFAYQAMAEVLSGNETSILCSDFYNEYTKLKKEDPKTGKSPVAKQFQILESYRQPLKEADCRTALDPNNAKKNRDTSIVPPDRSRPVLPVFQPEITSNYVNAVYVNGFKQRDQFVVTEMPLPHTVSDFWRMLKSTRTRTIVLLQDGEAEQYWPHESPVDHGALIVTTTSTEKEGNVIVRLFTIKGPGTKDEVTIKQFHFQNWKKNQEVPSSPDQFLDMIERVERWQTQTGNRPVTIQCLNGASACGVYCATVFVCDKIKSDQEVDVFLAVRSIRSNRPQLITSHDQYLFCYQMAMTFLDAFETYANFQ